MAGSRLGRNRLWVRSAVVLTVCTLVGLIFLETSPAAPPANVVTPKCLDARLTVVESKAVPLHRRG